MSELNTALKLIFSWLEKDYLEFAQSFQPGLSYEEMKNYENKLASDECHRSHYFTSEIYELYQWRNGTLVYPDGEIFKINDRLLKFSWDNSCLILLEDPNYFGELTCIPSIGVFLALYFLPMNYIYFHLFVHGICDDVALFKPFSIDSEDGDYLVSPNIRQEKSPLLNSVVEGVYEEVLSIDTDKICRKRINRKSSEEEWIIVQNYSHSRNSLGFL